MPLTTLKTTVAVLSLTAGTAFAQTSTDSNVAPEIDTTPTRQAQSDNDTMGESAGEDDAIRYTEENVREATEGEVNIADEGETDFSDADPILSGDVDDDGTLATDDGLATADVTAGDVVSAGETETVDQTMTDENTATDMDEANQEPNENTITLADLTAADLEGREIYDAQGELIGEIDEVVEMNGQVAAIVEVGGFLFFGGREVAISMDEIDVSIEDRLSLVATSKADFEAREGIDESQARELEPTEPLMR